MGSWVLIVLTQPKYVVVCWRFKSGTLYHSLINANAYLICTVFVSNFFYLLWRKKSKNKGHCPNKSFHLEERLLNKRT